MKQANFTESIKKGVYEGYDWWEILKRWHSIPEERKAIEKLLEDNGIDIKSDLGAATNKAGVAGIVVCGLLLLGAVGGYKYIKVRNLQKAKEVKEATLEENWDKIKGEGLGDDEKVVKAYMKEHVLPNKSVQEINKLTNENVVAAYKAHKEATLDAKWGEEDFLKDIAEADKEGLKAYMKANSLADKTIANINALTNVDLLEPYKEVKKAAIDGLKVTELELPQNAHKNLKAAVLGQVKAKLKDDIEKIDNIGGLNDFNVGQKAKEVDVVGQVKEKFQAIEGIQDWGNVPEANKPAVKDKLKEELAGKNTLQEVQGFQIDANKLQEVNTQLLEAARQVKKAAIDGLEVGALELQNAPQNFDLSNKLWTLIRENLKGQVGALQELNAVNEFVVVNKVKEVEVVRQIKDKFQEIDELQRNKKTNAIKKLQKIDTLKKLENFKVIAEKDYDSDGDINENKQVIKLNFLDV